MSQVNSVVDVVCVCRPIGGGMLSVSPVKCVVGCSLCVCRSTGSRDAVCVSSQVCSGMQSVFAGQLD